MSGNHDRVVVIADADGESRSLAAKVFRRAGYRTTQARSGTAALAAVHRDWPALVLLDVGLPGVSGYQVCHELREQYGHELPIVFLSATRTQSSDRVAGLLLGADDYVVKPFDPDELLARAERLIAPPAVAGSPGKRRATTNTQLGLTNREHQILDLLAAGLQQNDISNRLVISPKTVATHIQRILGKLGVHSRAEAVAKAHREGLIGYSDV